MTNKQLNILFTASWYPSKAHPTLGNFIQRHAEAVTEMHHVHVLYITSLDGHRGAPAVEQSKINGVSTTIIYCGKGWANKYRAFRFGAHVLFEKEQQHFDLIHHHVLWPHSWQARWLHSKYKIPYIVTEHWTGYDQSRSRQRHPLIKTLSQFGAAKAFAICPVTQNLASTLKEYGITANYRVVPNVVDTDLFNLTHAEHQRVRFLHVSSLVDDQKNISGMLRVWKKISDKFPDAHLTIGGDGPFQFWKKSADDMGIHAESISWFGEQTWQEVAAKMQASHYLLMFSNYENLPCVIVEAMACGLGIISTRVGGISEHINSDRGLLIGPGNEDELYSAIEHTCLQPDLFNRESLRQYAVQHFSKKAIAAQFDSIYREALG